MWQIVGRCVYKSALTPKPGPLGGPVRDVNPPAGSHEKRPLLVKKKKNHQFSYNSNKKNILPKEKDD